MAGYAKTREILQRGTRAAQPGAGTVQEGTLYYVTDEGVIERSDGTATWETFSGAGGAGTVGPQGPPGLDGADADDSVLWAPTVGAGSVRTVGMAFDGNGATPTVGTVGYLVCQCSGTVTNWTMIGDVSGSAVVDVWKAAGAIPVNGDSIAGSQKPTLTAQQFASSAAVNTWQTSVSTGDVFGFELESVTTCTRVTCQVGILVQA